jgi:DNA repair protein RadA/Sms
VLEELNRLRPTLVIVDSIQTVFSMRMQSAPGSVGQVREAATQLLFAAKSQDVPIFVVGHITKDGALAGPKTLEHVVDTVLYFEGERHHSHRVVRAVKNRFGAVSELGVFEMTSEGLRPVPNPSQLFLAERPDNAPGSAVHCAIEGSRPLLVEVQALVSSSTFGNARRTANGIDQGRLSLLLAVLEKRAGLHLAGEDVFVNVAGGMTIEEPAADLSVVAAVASSLRNRVITKSTAVFGEVGLAGEVRGISQAGLRVREAAQLGFQRCVLPRANIDPTDRALADGGCELIAVSSVSEALDALLV